MKLLTRHSVFYIFIILLNLAWSVSSFGCKYTVRDIGFTDLGPSMYRLYFYIDKSTSEELVSAFERLSYAAFLDANIKTEIINIEQQSDHPAMGYLKTQQYTALPAVTLVGPDGDKLDLSISFKSGKYDKALWQLFETVAWSPLRGRIVNLVKNTYGAVLLIQGTNEALNRRAEQTISSAINDISEVLKLMPKPIEKLPQVIVLSQPDIVRDKPLLWSLNAEDNPSEQPQVAILYGRGRRIGPTLRGNEITRENVFNLLAIIGADCECGLDRSVMLGKMIPLRWKKEIRAELSKQLGFDVENPMIKMEMSQILSIAPALQKGKNASSPLSAYKEGIIKIDSALAVPTLSSERFRARGFSGYNKPDNFLLHIALYSTGGIFVVVLIVGCFVFVKTKTKTGGVASKMKEE